MSTIAYMFDPTELAPPEPYKCDVRAGHGYEVHLGMQTHGYTLKATTQSHSALDHLIGMAMGYARVDGYPNLSFAVYPAVRPLPEDSHWANHARVDLKPDLDAAAVMLRIGEISYMTKTDKPRSGTELCWDTWNGPESMFPDNSVVTIPELRRVVHQFYDLSGAGLPTAVAWQELPEPIW
jgi:Immunity protein Imm1